MFSKIGTTELLVILAIILLVFGPKNLPKLGKAIGQTISGFKKGQKEALDEIKEEGEDAVDEAASSDDVL